MKDIGMRIRERRTELNLTIESVAEKINLSTVFVGDIERGKSFPSFETLIQISNALCVNTDYLCQDYTSDPSVKEYDFYASEIIEKISGMTDKQKNIILKSIDNLIEFNK